MKAGKHRNGNCAANDEGRRGQVQGRSNEKGGLNDGDERVVAAEAVLVRDKSQDKSQGTLISHHGTCDHVSDTGGFGAEVVECVPNFSEGRNPEIIRAIVGAIGSVPGVKVLDCSSDRDHNRTVITFIGNKESILEGAFQGVSKAVELIDMQRHEGDHPRIGAADVVPFIPISGVNMKDCVNIARWLGAMIADKLEVPVYLYGEAASSPQRRELSTIRKGQYEGLKSAIKNPERAPDFGPRRLHPTAGATAVGVRGPLIAYNVNLATRDLGVARDIVRAVRAATGGFATVKAMAVDLKESGQVQVSMNLTDCLKTPIHRVFELIKSEALARGVLVSKSEIVGLVPVQVLVDLAKHSICAHDLTKESILEMRLLD